MFFYNCPKTHIFLNVRGLFWDVVLEFWGGLGAVNLTCFSLWSETIDWKTNQQTIKLIKTDDAGARTLKRLLVVGTVSIMHPCRYRYRGLGWAEPG